jgi:hypothetical protein
MPPYPDQLPIILSPEEVQRFGEITFVNDSGSTRTLTTACLTYSPQPVAVGGPPAFSRCAGGPIVGDKSLFAGFFKSENGSA